MDSPAPTVFVQQLAALHDRYPEARIVTFVPRPQLGMALQTAVTQQRTNLAGLAPTTVAQYAKTWADLPLKAKGLRPLNAGDQMFLTVAALHDVSSATRHTLVGDSSASGLINPLRRTFDTLRSHRIDADTYRTTVATTERQEAQAQVYARYQELLHKHNYYDTTRLLETARHELEESGPDFGATVFAFLDVLELTAVSKSLLSAIIDPDSGDPPPTFRLGTDPDVPLPDPHALQAPPERVAVQFSDLPRPPEADAKPSAVGRLALEPNADPSFVDAPSIRCWTATGARREVQAVFEDIVARERPLDTVEIAFTTEDPYLSYIDALADRYDIDVSLSTGRALSATRPGQMLLGIFEWIAEGFPVETLIELLRAEQIRFCIALGPDGQYGMLTSPEAATLLAQRRYGDGPGSYRNALRAWIEELDDELQSLQAAESEAAWLDEAIEEARAQKAKVEALWSVIDTILEYCQVVNRNDVSPSTLATGVNYLLQRFGPVDEPTESEESYTPDEVAREQLIERLGNLGETTSHQSRPLRSLAADMSTWVELKPYIRARRPHPGEVHVVLLESAGYADRDHLYVVGLDATSTAAQLTDDPLLTDDDRHALSAADVPLPLRRNRADTDTWLVGRALARHRGTVTLTAPTYDVAEDEERFESPLFLRIQEALGSTDTSVAHRPLAPDPARALTDLDRWSARQVPSSARVAAVLESSYPWIRQGLQASAARQSDAYTAYDGLLDADWAEIPNPLEDGRSVSAGHLETYARAPFAYFLKYILEVEPLEEPALDDVAWLDARDRGDVLHTTFREFMDDIQRRPTSDDIERLHQVFSTVLDDKRARVPPPSEVVFSAAKRQLWNDALLFLNAESNRPDEHTPDQFEWGFGLPPHRCERNDSTHPAVLELGQAEIRLRGRVDRVDRHPDGTVSLWDYKTGSSRDFEDGNLLDGGRHLQWVLYAYAYEALQHRSVSSAGYFFTSTQEMGKRVTGDPEAARDRVSDIVARISAALSAGAFPVTDADSLRYNYDRLFDNFGDRKSQLRSKEWPDDRPVPPPLADE